MIDRTLLLADVTDCDVPMNNVAVKLSLLQSQLP